MKYLLSLFLVLANFLPKEYLVKCIDTSNLDDNVAIVWVSDSTDRYKVLLFLEDTSTESIPEVDEIVNWVLSRYDRPRFSILGGGDTLFWHSASNWPRCWTNLSTVVCPDSDSTSLWVLNRY